jgi:asparagine synthase (glutamine-hydrolysing)
MCGVFGLFSPNGTVLESTLLKATAALNHRGPDGSAILINDKGNAGLGHARLSIIGIDNGTQPITNEDGQISIVINGELYGYEKQREELIKRGHRFSTDSDSEVALHLYEEFGVNCVEHLRGEFAFIIWDNRQQRLFAARDRFGIKPLVYSVVDGTIYLASEAKALFAAGVTAHWDEESFFHSASMQYTLPSRTLFRNVNQLRPGHFLVASGGDISTYCYWDLDYGIETAEAYDEQDLIEQFADRFSDAVKVRLRADTPVCCHLSGGLDSSAVLGFAMRHSSSPVTCFTVSFEEESYDELEIASEMAAKAGVKLNAVKVGQRDLIEHLQDAVYYSEGFAVNGHLTAKYLLNRAIRKAGFKVALTGEGSDELVAGYPHLRTDLYRSNGDDHLIEGLYASNNASKGIMLKQGQMLSLKKVQQRLGYTPSFLEAKGSLGHKLTAVLAQDYKATFNGRDCYDDLLDCINIEGQLAGRNQVNQSLYLWSKTALANYILRTLGDGMEMANSVEGRLPFLDHQLFEFVRRLPVSMKIKGTVEKFVLREAARPVITETIYHRQKHPFVAPPLSTFSTPAASAMLHDVFASSSFSSLPFFDREKLFKLIQRLPEMQSEERSAMDPVLMTALSAAALHERYRL